MTQTVLITGTSSGMGRELTAQFAHRGWNVVATTRSAASRTDVHQLPGVVATDLDVTDPARARQVVAEALDRFGAIDVLINNAGFAQLGALEEIDLDGWRAQYETNVFGLVSVTQAVLPSMRARRAGHIILISSMGAM
jgi:NAD(P)-dependent dehydrogenase (short-subunit alcohol dehydrogenase family)